MALDDDLPTISEEDSDSARSGSVKSSSDTKVPLTFEQFLAAEDQTGRLSPPSSEETGNSNNKQQQQQQQSRDKKKKKKSKKDNVYFSDDHVDTAQQILVDLCTEMKELKTTMQIEAEKTNTTMLDNITSNNVTIKSLADQMEMLQGNMKQLDMMIESKATPEQIEEMSRIRAVQEMLRVAAEDKDKTVEIYETHAKRGYEEIERLRQDLASERKEVSSLRAELDMLREERRGGGEMSVKTGPGALYINGDGHSVGRPNTGGGSVGTFDDMTLETKASYDTMAYETKSLKKRIIHMKKKLSVAQMEAKEVGDLRAEVERLRVQHETEKRSSKEKDETIQRLKDEILELRRSQANAAPRPQPVTPPATSQVKTSPGNTHQTKTVTAATKKNKWWQNL